MNDMRAVIVPKSDQINADDLLGGPITITITDVKIRPGTEQPVSIFFEGDGGKPYKPCKSMARVMVHCWGPDANIYIGRVMTLYCDPTVRWGGMEVGGIRISHMTHLNGVQTMALTATKGSKKPFVVKPFVEARDAAPPQSLADWFKAVAADFSASSTRIDVDAILAREDVQHVQGNSAAPKAQQKLQALIDAALARTEPSSDDGDLPDDDSSAEDVA